MREIKPIPLKKVIKGLSTMDKIRYGILCFRLSKSEIAEMKQILKVESRKIIAEVGEPKLSIIKAMEQYLEEYIDGLSKRDTLRLYMAYLEVKEAIDEAQTQYAKFEFLAKMYQTYMKDGWSNNSAAKIKTIIKKTPAARKVRRLIRRATTPLDDKPKKAKASKKKRK
jgi:hypothetical protein